MNLRKYVIGLHKQIRRLTSFKVAYQEWSDKTDWVQQSVQSGELGKHRADAIKARYDALKAENERLKITSECADNYAAMFEEASEENESLRKDAARYQWIRDVMCLEHLRETVESAQSAEDYDFCIDQDISRDNDSPENPS